CGFRAYRFNRQDQISFGVSRPPSPADLLEPGLRLLRYVGAGSGRDAVRARKEPDAAGIGQLWRCRSQSEAGWRTRIELYDPAAEGFRGGEIFKRGSVQTLRHAF